MNINIKKLTETAIVPTRASDGAAGFDLYADSVEGAFEITSDNSVIVASGSTIKVHTGIAMAIPKGYVGLLFARSGLACKQGLRPANCVGVIDEDYRGEIVAVLHADVDNKKFDEMPNGNINIVVNKDQFASFKLHDRVAQLVFVKYEAFTPAVVDNLDNTERGTGGFGSTGSV
jgi:dUTP pyrophosphatase